MLANLTRVVVSGAVHHVWGVDWSTGWEHDVLGFLIVAVAFLLLVSTDYLLGWRLGSIDKAIMEDQVLYLPGTPLYVRENPFNIAWNFREQKKGISPIFVMRDLLIGLILFSVRHIS